MSSNTAQVLPSTQDGALVATDESEAPLGSLKLARGLGIAHIGLCL